MKFKPGDKVRLVAIPPPTVIDGFFATRGTIYYSGMVMWKPRFDNYATHDAFTVLKVEMDLIKVVGQREEFFHESWLVLSEATCVCDITTLMVQGCQCGQMERER